MSDTTINFQHVKCTDCPQFTWCAPEEIGTDDQRCITCHVSFNRWRQRP